MLSRSLSGGSPRRLWLDQGRWVLEVVRHVNIGHDLVRPTTERISGNRLITSYFKSNPDQEPLARSALKLMQAPTGDNSPSYSAIGAEWIRGSIPPPAMPDSRERSERQEEEPGLETRVAELSARVTALVALQEGLLVRLARLEARVGEGGGPAHAPRAAPIAAAPPRAPLAAASKDLATAEDAVGEEQPEPAARAAPAARPVAARPAEPDAPPARETPGVQFLEPSPSRPPAPRLSMPGPAPAVDERARPRQELELPPLAELSRCIALLVGNDIVVQQGEELSVTAELLDCYAAALEDDSGEQVGLILMDLRATVFLGGTLMMQPRDQLEQQFAAANPEQDSIAASAEICNALSGAVNAAQSRYHVRTSGLSKFSLDQYDWAPTPAARRDLEDSFGGLTTLLSRPTGA